MRPRGGIGPSLPIRRCPRRIWSDTRDMALPTRPPVDVAASTPASTPALTPALTPASGSGPGFRREPGAAAPPTLRALLAAAVAHGASDLHVRAGSVPLVRISGDLFPLEMAPLDGELVQAMVLDALASDRDRQGFMETREADFAVSEPGIGCFRANAYWARGGAAMVLRHVRDDVPTLDGLGLPPIVRALTEKSAGLILVCGPTGSGKTTTLAAMVGAINATRRCHILTIEDPIEFLHTDAVATVSQRELHTDTLDFATALRAGLRQDPDVILVGEIRDLATMRTALQAAETGHLVLASLHASSVVDAVNRVIDVFPVEEQRQARRTIAESLQGVLCQQLVPAASGAGRRMVMEIAVGTPRLREAVADPDKTELLEDIIAEGDYYGMRTFEQDAVRLVLSGDVTVHAAEAVVPRPADLHVALRRQGYRDAEAGV